VFVQLEDGIAYVVEDGEVLNDPGGSGSLAWVSERHIADTIHAAELCPGECIFIEVDVPVGVGGTSDTPDLVDLADDVA
jgi:ferredoxin